MQPEYFILQDHDGGTTWILTAIIAHEDTHHATKAPDLQTPDRGPTVPPARTANTSATNTQQR